MRLAPGVIIRMCEYNIILPGSTGMFDSLKRWHMHFTGIFSTAIESQRNALLGPATIAKFTHMYSQHLRAWW
jgi:hypothetical protein